eukprot:10936287-Alexandrium_andersonii.AAC.1
MCIRDSLKKLPLGSVGNPRSAQSFCCWRARARRSAAPARLEAKSSILRRTRPRTSLPQPAPLED